MKKLLYLALLICFTGCEDFLDTQNYKEKDDSNFPMTEEDVYQLVTGVYSTMNLAQKDIAGNYFLVSQMASDECFGGGGMSDKQAQSSDHMLIYNENLYKNYWEARYKGINYANKAIAELNELKESETRNQKLGECYTLRAYFYFELAQMFERVPLIISLPSNVNEVAKAPKQAEPDEIYANIASDLKKACELMPSKKWNEYPYGTVTKWVAESLLGRVYLFYTGFYKKESLPTLEGTPINKQYVINKLEDCIKNSGHSLVSDFRSLWPYSNKSTLKDIKALSVDERPKWYSDEIQEWVRDGDNPEQVFVLTFRYFDSYPPRGEFLNYINQYPQYIGFRSVSNLDYEKEGVSFPIGKGWGFAPVSTNFYHDNNWESEDKRKDYSVMYIDPTSYNGDHQMEASGYWQLKYAPISCYNKDGKRLASFASSTDYWGDGIKSDYQCSQCQAMCIIRFADVLLMQAELTENMKYTIEIRNRAGLSPITGYSLEAIQNERSHELAFEGVRWGDIRRWHIAEEVLQKQVGQKIYNNGIEKRMVDQKAGYVERYKATRGFFNIPQSEIDLSNGVFKQNPGWEGDIKYDTWSE